MAEGDWPREPEGLLPPSLRRRNPPRRLSNVVDSRGRGGGSSSGSSLEDLRAAARPTRRAAKGQARSNGAEPAKGSPLDARLGGRGPARKSKARRPGRPAALDSSPDEREASGVEEPPRAQLDPGKKRSRASRTRRYLKRICNAEQFQPIEPAAATARQPEWQREAAPDGSYNPLVQQTLRYFSEFEREAAASAPAPPPPRPPCRDHTSRLLVDGASLDRYRRTMRQPPPDEVACAPAAVRRPAPLGDPPGGGSAPRRGSRNLEEALCELEAIYNSLQLGDEELLDRAERRTMEEFLYKGLTAAPPACGDEHASRRNTWADSSLAAAHKEERHEADRLKDDMAYRRMHPKERPTSVDGQSCLSGISYLMTSPEPSRRHRPDEPSVNGRRRREPDVTLDDVVFRSMHHANNTLKVLEPQPPFGIPLGPISAAPDSDYLHSQPCADWERARSPCREPDLVTDDLAFRSLRKDALQPGSGASRQSSPSLLPSSPSPLMPARGWRPAYLHGPRPGSTLDDRYPDEPPPPPPPPPRRISDPELASPRWHARRSESDPSGESSDEQIRPSSRLADDDHHHHHHARRSADPPPPSRGSPSPPAPPARPLEVSAYQQLCQDLENLVQLTRGIGEDVAPAPAPKRPSVEPPESAPIVRQLSAVLDGLEALERLQPREPIARQEAPAPVGPETSDRLDDAAQEDDEGRDRVDEGAFPRDARPVKPTAAAAGQRRASLVGESQWEGANKCNHKYNSMPAKTSSLLMFRQYGSKRKSKNRKSMCSIS